MSDPGFAVWDDDPAVKDWACAAHRAALRVDTSTRRHGGTWFVGVAALPNGSDGSIGGVPWPHRAMCDPWHRAQLSIVYPGYPKQGAGESDAAHRFRAHRDAAHLDGVLPEGPDKRRHLREPHAFILGVPLNAATASPLVVWEGSHRIMQAAFAKAFAGFDPAQWGDLDVTEIYQSARRSVFETCPRITVPARVGQVIWLQRHMIHGVAPWRGEAPEEGRMIAYFRPVLADVAQWI